MWVVGGVFVVLVLCVIVDGVVVDFALCTFVNGEVVAFVLCVIVGYLVVALSCGVVGVCVGVGVGVCWGSDSALMAVVPLSKLQFSSVSVRPCSMFFIVFRAA